MAADWHDAYQALFAELHLTIIRSAVGKDLKLWRHFCQDPDLLKTKINTFIVMLDSPRDQDRSLEVSMTVSLVSVL